MTLDEAIKALGTTQDEVTAKLKESGIKGYRRMASSCPIAKYLNGCGFPFVTVGGYVNVYASNSSQDAEYTYHLPHAVRMWALDFDAGYYPEFYLE